MKRYVQQQYIFFVFLLFCALASHSLSALHEANSENSPKKSALYTSRSDGGMFYIVRKVVRFCQLYDAGIFSGLEVNFFQSGAYYDPNYGDNWWTYYFHPIKLGNCTNNVQEFEVVPRDALEKAKGVPLHSTTATFQKYIRVKKDILQEVDDFVEKNFRGYFVISVHYRGTDKITEAPRVEYEVVSKHINEVLKKNRKKKVKIFVATDEMDFIAYAKEQFGDKICYKEDIERALGGEPLHKNSKTPYDSGRGAVIDCLLLSRGSYLIRTSSNLSLIAAFFNPRIPVLQINERYNKDGKDKENQGE